MSQYCLGKYNLPSCFKKKNVLCLKNKRLKISNIFNKKFIIHNYFQVIMSNNFCLS